MNISTLRQELLDNNGFSYSLQRGDCNGLPMYAVGRKGHEMQFNEPPSTEQIADYIRGVSIVLAASDSCVGAWLHDDVYYLDVSLLVPKEIGLEEALELGVKHGQIAIFDLETGDVINTGCHA